MLSSTKPNYFTEERFNRGDWREWFVVLFIGKAKMRDLASRLNGNSNYFDGS